MYRCREITKEEKLCCCLSVNESSNLNTDAIKKKHEKVKKKNFLEVC